MGFFLKKSINLGICKLNLSKSGIGFSFGVKGFRVNKNSRGTQLNIGRKGLYYRKQISSNKKLNQTSMPEIEINEETVLHAPVKKAKKITKTPQQEYFEFALAMFTLCLIISFVLLFVKFVVGFILAIITFCLRQIVINKNRDKYEVYLKNPEPQLYYLGKMPSQIKELEEQAQINNIEIKKQEVQRRNENKYKEYNYSHERLKGSENEQ